MITLSRKGLSQTSSLVLHLQGKYEFLCDAHESGGDDAGEDEQAAIDVNRH